MSPGPRQTEGHDLQLVAAGRLDDHHVLQLQITIDDPIWCRELSPSNRSVGETTRTNAPAERHPSAAFRASRPPRHQFHNQKRTAGSDGAVIGHARDAPMVNFRGGPCLALAVLKSGESADERSHHHLRRQLTVQPQVGRFEYGAGRRRPSARSSGSVSVTSAPSAGAACGRASNGRTPDIP